MIWFTSDTHFNHENVIQHDKRPFANLFIMTETIISNWNSVVAKGDIVYHLGDFALSWGKKHYQIIDDILGRLNGQKILIRGNHDRAEVLKNPKWLRVSEIERLSVDLGGEHKQWITVCHYAWRTWYRSHYGSWMLHGHSHGLLPDNGSNSMDVGTMCHNYFPINIDTVKEFMSKRQQAKYTKALNDNGYEL